jgi:hypothetical protein
MRVMLAAVLAACRTAPAAVQSPAPVVRAPAPTPVEDEPPPLKTEIVSAPAPAAIPSPSDLPMFARPDVDLEREFPLRATIRTIGWTYETAQGQGAVAGDGSSRLFEQIVIDDGATTDPRRVRLLCEEPHHRIAVYVDAHDLMVTVRDQTLMVARPKLPKRVHDRTPGVRIEPGAPLLVQHRPAKGLASVRYEGEFVDAAGFVPVSALDVVYVGERAEWSMQPNAEVIHHARLYDRPAGHELARVLPSARDDPRWVETLGPREGKWRLVRYGEQDVHVIGWIDKKHLRRRAGEMAEPYGGLGIITRAPAHPIALPRGTRFVGRSGTDVLGIVTERHDFECIADCRTTAPLVLLDTCTSPMQVRALLKG